MNRYKLSYDEVLDMSFKKLVSLANSIPKFDSQKTDEKNKKDSEKTNISNFVKENNLIK